MLIKDPLFTEIPYLEFQLNWKNKRNFSRKKVFLGLGRLSRERHFKAGQRRVCVQQGSSERIKNLR